MKDYRGVITEHRDWIDEKDASHITGKCSESQRRCKECKNFHLVILDKCPEGRFCPMHGKYLGDFVCAGVLCNAKSDNCPTNKEKSK